MALRRLAGFAKVICALIVHSAPGLCLSIAGSCLGPRSRSQLRVAGRLVGRAASAGWSPRRRSDPPAPRVVAGAGWLLRSNRRNGDYRLQIGLLLHADGRFALDDEGEQYVDTFAIRRLRPVSPRPVRAAFRVLPESRLRRRHADRAGRLRRHDLRAGVPHPRRQGQRRRSGSSGCSRRANMLFMERALPDRARAQPRHRRAGARRLSGGVVSYLAGVMNGVTDGGSADLDTNDSKDVSGRLVVRPFNRANSRAAPRGVSGSASRLARRRARHRRVAGAPHADAAAALLFVCHRRHAGAVADGVRTRYSPQRLVLLQGLRRAGPNTCTRETAGPPRRHAAPTSTTTRGRSRARGC